jgi:hypothetical protein
MNLNCIYYLGAVMQFIHLSFQVTVMHSNCLQSPSLSIRHVILCEMAHKWNSHRIQQDAYGAAECQNERYLN